MAAVYTSVVVYSDIPVVAGLMSVPELAAVAVPVPVPELAAVAGPVPVPELAAVAGLVPGLICFRIWCRKLRCQIPDCRICYILSCNTSL